MAGTRDKRPDDEYVRIAKAATLGVGASERFEFQRAGKREQGFVLRHRHGLVAYANCCPHWYVDLDLGDGRFYAEDLDRIYCKNHGALFVPETGVCDYGPCFGERLESFDLEIDDNDVVVFVSRPRS